MAPGNIPTYLPGYLSAPSTPRDAAIDALEEWILYRRAKGDTLFEVSVGLAEIESKTPPHTSGIFNRARYVTNTPEPHNLTPPTGPFPLSRSQSPQTILHHLLSPSPPSLEHSREVILEYVLGKEQKAREKRPGRGGKGTLGREIFEEISSRLGEVEDGLKGGMTSPRAGGSGPGQGMERVLDPARQMDLALILSLRLSLSYFTPRELADQLLVLSVSDVERTLVQHIRRRVPGEGRWGVGRELEYVESLVTSRPALRPAFRSAKTRTGLAQVANYPITLPAPTKSTVIKLLGSFVRDVEEGRPPGTPSSPSGRYFSRAPTTPGTSSSPKTPLTPLPPLPANDPNAIANYALELVSEYLTREKREHMLKQKWAKSGREQLGKDLGDIEMSFKSSGILIPVFLVLRRTFALPPSPLPADYIDPYIDILPAPPDPDDVPFREPSVQSSTATLYVNPRLSDEAAMGVVSELVENEKEILDGATDEEKELWIGEQIDAVAKRFPDGSYAEVFARAKETILQSALPPLKPAHRRAQSNQATPVRSMPSHSRSLSMPMRDTPDDSDSDLEPEPFSPATVMTARVQPASTTPVTATQPAMAINTSHKALPPLQMLSPSSSGPASSGWWDVVSAVQHRGSAPWHNRTASGNSITTLPLPPGAEPAVVADQIDLARLEIDTPPPPPVTGRSAGNSPISSPGVDEQGRERTIRLVGQGGVGDVGNVGSSGQQGFAGHVPAGQAQMAQGDPWQQGRQRTISSPQILQPPIGTNSPVSPAQNATAGSSQIAEPSPTGRSRLFGRSLTLHKPKEDKEKDKEKEKEKEQKGRKPVRNEPGRWNRDMVANIMGPPADRR